MGFLDKIFRSVAKEATETITNMVTDSVSGVMGGASQDVEYDTRSFEEKLTSSLSNLGNYQIEKNISIESIEAEQGQDVYVHRTSKCYRLPSSISYGVYEDGKLKGYIRLWSDYGEYTRIANREIYEYCRKNSLPLLDFFEYLPNEQSYIQNRIASFL